MFTFNVISKVSAVIQVKAAQEVLIRLARV